MRAGVGAAVLVTVFLCASCAVSGDAGRVETAERPSTWAGPPSGPFDYQLGGGYEPAPDVVTVVRDATDEPVPGLYSVCYVNGFQTQPQEGDHWLGEYPDLVLHDAGGDPVADPGWPDEFVLDTSTTNRRERIADLVGETVTACAEQGFDAVEFDNLDSFTRSGGVLSADDSLALAADLVATAHEEGLAAAQKNAAELAGRARKEAGFDFAVAEECVAYDECSAYTDVYGAGVLAVEYPDTLGTALTDVCDDPATPPFTLLRDRDLVTSDAGEHLRESC